MPSGWIVLRRCCQEFSTRFRCSGDHLGLWSMGNTDISWQSWFSVLKCSATGRYNLWCLIEDLWLLIRMFKGVPRLSNILFATFLASDQVYDIFWLTGEWTKDHIFESSHWADEFRCRSIGAAELASPVRTGLEWTSRWFSVKFWAYQMVFQVFGVSWMTPWVAQGRLFSFCPSCKASEGALIRQTINY